MLAVAGIFQLPGVSDAVPFFQNHFGLIAGGAIAFSVLVAGIASWITWAQPPDKKCGLHPPAPLEYTMRFAKPDDYDEIIEVFREEFGDQVLLDAREYQRLMLPGRNIVRVLEADFEREGKKIIGYYSLWPMERSTFDGLWRGKLHESKLDNSLILDFADTRATVAYIADYCVARRYRAACRRYFLDDFKSYLRNLLFEYRHLGDIVAWSYTTIGQGMCELLRMKRIARPCFTSLVGFARIFPSLKPVIYTKFFEIGRTDALAYLTATRILPFRRVRSWGRLTN